MTLKEWLKAENKIPYLFAKEIGISKSKMYRVLNGEVTVTDSFAYQLERITGGKVTASEVIFSEERASYLKKLKRQQEMEHANTIRLQTVRGRQKIHKS